MAALRDLNGPLPLHLRIMAERVLAGLTASQCARAMAVLSGRTWSHTLWQRIENGTRDLSEVEVARVAKIVGVTVRRLRGDQPRAVPGWQKRGRPFAKSTASAVNRTAGRVAA